MTQPGTTSRQQDRWKKRRFAKINEQRRRAAIRAERRKGKQAAKVEAEAAQEGGEA